MRERMRFGGVGVAALILLMSALSGCGGHSSNDDTATVTDYLVQQNLGRPITASCEGDYARWQCYFDHFDVPSSGRVDVYLSTPGGVDDDALSSDARRWVENMITLTGDAPVHPDNIVCFINGVDSGTTQVS